MDICFNQSKLEKSFRAVFLSCLLWNIQPHLVVFTLFILSKGYTLFDFFIFEASASIVALVAEIPTGMIADRIGRKRSLQISTAIGIVVTFALIFSIDYWTILIATSIGGIAGAFRSGADMALLYDSLKSIGREKDFIVVNGQLKWWSGLLGAVASILGGILAQFDLSLAWWCWLFVIISCFVVLFFVIEPTNERDEKANNSVIFDLGQSLRTTFLTEANYFILYAVFIWLFFSLGFWLWQPYLKSITLPVAYFGAIYALSGVIGGYSSKLYTSIQDRYDQASIALLIPLGLSLVFLIQAQQYSIGGFVLIFMHSFFSGIFSAFSDVAVNARIQSSNRATVLSIKNMLSTLLFIVVSPIVGWLERDLSLSSVYSIMAVALFFVGILFYLIAGKRNSI